MNKLKYTCTMENYAEIKMNKMQQYGAKESTYNIIPFLQSSKIGKTKFFYLRIHTWVVKLKESKDMIMIKVKIMISS